MCIDIIDNLSLILDLSQGILYLNFQVNIMKIGINSKVPKMVLFTELSCFVENIDLLNTYQLKFL
jgi:hypothetical protein